MIEEDFLANFKIALSRYSKEDLDTFFDRAGVTDADLRSIGTDYLGIAGSFYLSAMARQKQQVRRGDTLKHLAKAQKASKELAESLATALADRSLIHALAERAPSIQAAYPTEQDRKEDSFRILDSVFPLSKTGKGFRYDGLSRALLVLADELNQIEVNEIAKQTKGRSQALHPWMLLMSMYWAEATQSAPRSGHYDKEVADYSSPAVAALTFAIEKIDPEVTSRLIVKALGSAMQSFDQSLTEAYFLLSMGFGQLLGSDIRHSSPETLRKWMGAPEALFKMLDDKPPKLKATIREEAIITEDEFFETLISSKMGNLLLRTLMEIDKG